MSFKIDLDNYSLFTRRDRRGGGYNSMRKGEVRAKMYYPKEKGKYRNDRVTFYISAEKSSVDFTQLYILAFDKSPDKAIAILVPVDEDGWKFTTSAKESKSGKIRFDVPINQVPRKFVTALWQCKESCVKLSVTHIEGAYIVELK